MRYVWCWLAATVLVWSAGCDRRDRVAEAKALAMEQRAFEQAQLDAKIKAGQAALEAKRYEDAVREFTDAFNLAPADAGTKAWLDKAMQARKDFDYNQHMQAGQEAWKARDYTRAANEFNDAVRHYPDDKNTLDWRRTAVVTAWKEAGAEVGWMRTVSDGIIIQMEFLPAEFTPEKNRVHDTFLGFRLRNWKLGLLSTLPKPGMQFGLDLSVSGFSDDGVKEVIALGGVHILNVAYTKITAAGREELKKAVPNGWISR